MIQRAYINTFYKELKIQTHYRAAGEGAPLIMLHPSPLSSAVMEPLMNVLEGQACLYAPDTPGYGMSDPLPSRPENLDAYVDWLCALQDALGLESSAFYGSATGAQIAIHFARCHPERTRCLVLENAVHFTDEEREWIMKDYFPSMAPRPDGSHLALAWEMSSRLFNRFPWFDDRDEAVVSEVAMPTEVVHATALAYLQAGADYDWAYRAAFNNEDARNLQQVSCPTRVIRWRGSILRKYAKRLDDFQWPEHIQMVDCDGDLESRYGALRRTVSDLLS